MVDFPVADLPSSQIEIPGEIRKISELKGAESKDPGADEKNKLRADAIRQEGLRVGAQSGLAYRYDMIMDYLDKVEPKLNVTFNFAPFVRDSHLLIPSVVEVSDQLTMEGNDVHRVKTGITVEEEARVVTSIPTWRDYLYQRYDAPELPHETLYPRTDYEVSAWKKGLIDGWNAGVYQANEVYTDRLNQLAKAVEGRHEYDTLEAKHMFIPADLRVVSNQVTFRGRTMNVGEQIISIGQPGNFTEVKKWAPIWTR